MEDILAYGFHGYLDLLMKEDLFRSVRGGYYTKAWKEVREEDLSAHLHSTIRRVGIEFQNYVKLQGWLNQDNDGSYAENTLKIYGKPAQWKQLITAYKKAIVIRTKNI